MPIIQASVPLADVQRDSTLGRIVDRLARGKQPDADIIALAKYLCGNLKIEVCSTST